MQFKLLDWPHHIQPMKPGGARRRARFGTESGEWGSRKPLTLHQAVARLHQEIKKWTKPGQNWVIDPEKVVIAADYQNIRQDGLPYAGQKPISPAVCVYFELDGEPYSMPCDTYDRAEDNICAIAIELQSKRASIRHGVGSARLHFTGWKALPARIDAKWRTVLRVGQDATRKDARREYLKLSCELHPDSGSGDIEKFQEVQSAWEQAQQYFGTIR